GSGTNWIKLSKSCGNVAQIGGAIDANNALYVWGVNSDGRAGVGSIFNISTPTQIGGNYYWETKSSPVQVGTSSWTQVAIGLSQGAAIRSDGTLWAWGMNTNGELGVNDRIHRSSPVQVGTQYSVIDSSANNFTITNTNGVQTSTLTPFNGTGSSLYFTGANYLNATDNVAVQIGTSDFTIEFWYYSNNAGIDHILYDQRPSGTNGFYPTIAKSGPPGAQGRSNFYYYVNSAVTIQGTIVCAPQTWYHIAVSRSGSSTKLFVNGVQDGSTWTDTSNYLGGTSRPVFGTNGSSIGATYLYGNLSNIRLLKGTALYTSNFTPPTSPLTAIANTSLLINSSTTLLPNVSNIPSSWTQISIGDSQMYAVSNTNNLFAWGVNTDGRLGTNDLISRSTPTQVGALIQSASANINVPVNYSGTPLSSANTPLTDGTGSLLGGGNYLYTSPSSNYTLDADFTLEYWFFSTDSGATFNDQFNIGTMAGGSGNGIGVRLNSSDSVYLNGQFGFVNNLLALCPVSTWNHLAISRTGTTLKIFVNGTQQYSGTYTQILNSTGAAIYLFYSPDDSRSFPGYLTNFRLIKGTGLYSTNFTPTTTKLTAVANTVFLFTGPTYDSYNWSKVSSYSTATLAINSANTLATWGVSTNGSLVEGNFVTRPNIKIVGNTEVFVTSDTPNQILTSDTWKAVAIDYEGYSKAAIKTNGTLWTWGINDAGQLGQGDAISRSSPVQVGVYNWSSVQMGYRHIAALRDNNYLFTWGNNANGQLGDGTVTNRNSPVIIGGAIANNQYQLIATGSVYNNFFLK
ncbi:MAG: LamG-like jellyroll fold domain-containing protein, partial [Ferruginibacter sp.]